jgi:hypothetical protein
VDTAVEELAGVGEPSLDLVDPRGAGGGEVQCEAGVFGQPVLDGWGFVGGEVVTDQVHVQLGRDRFVDRDEEFLELDRPVLDRRMH